MQTIWNFRGRNGQAIDQGWGLLPDPMGRCRRQTWWKAERVPGEFFPCYDEDAFWATTVPGSFVRCHPELAYYEGEVVYRVHFDFDLASASADERVFIYFEDLRDRGSIYLNGKLLGEFDGPHQPYAVDITDMIAEHNRLLMMIDNKRRATDAPGEIHDWFHEGGIPGPVSIYRIPKIAIRETRVRTRVREDGQLELNLDAVLDAPCRDRAVPASFTLLDPRTGEEREGAAALARGAAAPLARPRTRTALAGRRGDGQGRRHRRRIRRGGP